MCRSGTREVQRARKTIIIFGPFLIITVIREWALHYYSINKLIQWSRRTCKNVIWVRWIRNASCWSLRLQFYQKKLEFPVSQSFLTVASNFADSRHFALHRDAKKISWSKKQRLCRFEFIEKSTDVGLSPVLLVVLYFNSTIKYLLYKSKILIRRSVTQRGGFMLSSVVTNFFINVDVIIKPAP